MTMTTDQSAVPAWLDLDAIAPQETRASVPRLNESGERLLALLLDWFEAADLAMDAVGNGCTDMGCDTIELVDLLVGSGPLNDLMLLLGTIAECRHSVITVEHYDVLCERYKIAGRRVDDIRGELEKGFG